MFTLLLVSVLFLISVSLVLWWIKESGAHKLPPKYPGELPIIGHSYLSLTVHNGKHVYELMTSLIEDCIRQGGVTCVVFGTKLYYGITDPDDLLTASNSCLEKHYAYKFSEAWLGDGLITSPVTIWKVHRKLLMPAFSPRMVDDFLGIFNEHSRLFLQDVASHVDKEPFDQVEYFRMRALQLFCAAAFGLNDSEDKEFINKYMEAIDEILSIIMYRFQKFWLHNNFIYKYSSLKKKEDKLIETLHGMSNGVIRRKKEEMKKRKLNDSRAEPVVSRCKPLLDLLLELTSDDKLSDKEIREEVDTAIVAGFDTTSNALVLITMMLGAHLRVQDRLYEEVIQVIGSNRDVEKEDLQKLVYTEAVIKETLRVITTGPVMMRYVDKDVKLKNYTMRAGSYCALLLFGTHKDPDIWGADVNEFRPERWLDTASLPDAFVSFSTGKRSCIGKYYAMMSMKVTLAHFVRRYKILNTGYRKLDLYVDFMLKPAAGHEISITMRSCSN